ncbi:MAG TPA: glycerate kinase [Candidatus Limnocylindrales bacterium]|nr:glycerate kinase [Candidatus Limnocylindrales bacterium]
MAAGGLQVLVAPDSFKGSLDPLQVARALAEGWRRARPLDEIRLIPLADGGEGTLEAVKASGGEWLELPVHARDPLGRPLRATFLRRGDQAIVEMASASGLSRLAPGERDAMAASTLGTGQVLAAAIGLGVREVVIGLGGSATTDGGTGLLTALGARFLDDAGKDLPPGGGALDRLAAIELDELSPVLAEVKLTVASDVTNPLLGERGAAATYGPQKGADDEQVSRLDTNLAHYADLLEQVVGRSVRDQAGSGAAGGTTAGLLAIADRFASFEVRPGVDVVMELTGFDGALATSDVVLTGEGRIDAQTAFGKTAMGVARRAGASGVACICFGGGVLPEGIAALAEHGAVVMPVTERPMSLEEALAAGPHPLQRAAERVARLVGLPGRQAAG